MTFGPVNVLELTLPVENTRVSFPGRPVIEANGSEDKSIVTVSGWGKSRSASLTPELSGTILGSGAKPNSTISFYFDGITSDIHNVPLNVPVPENE